MAVKKVAWKSGESKKVAWASTFYDDDGGRHRKQGFSTRKAAEAWEHKERALIEKASLAPAQKPITVSELCDEWLLVLEKGLGERKAVEKATLNDYEISVRLYIKPALGIELVASLTSSNMVTFRAALLEATTRAKAKRILRHFRIALNYAVVCDYIRNNPAQAVKIADDHRADDTVDIPSRAIMIEILEQLDKEVAVEAASGHNEHPWLRFAVLFRVLQGAGLRISEARGLAWNAIDLDNATINVRQRADRYGSIGQPKSAAAYRCVVVGDGVIEWLRRWKPHCAVSEYDLVFPTREGKALLLSNMYKAWWKPLCTKIKIVDATGKPLYGFHAARHFRVSEKIAIGTNVREIMAEIGHASSSLTLDIYGHLFPEDFGKRRTEANEIEKKLGQKAVR